MGAHVLEREVREQDALVAIELLLGPPAADVGDQAPTELDARRALGLHDAAR